MHRIHLLLLPALACASFAGAAIPGDPPSRVARLSYLRGPVSYSPAGVDAWAQASLNRPVVAGDRVWTDRGARDELQVGNAAIRMDGGSLLNVLSLDDQVMQMQLTQGTLDIRVRTLPGSGAIEVDTPNLAFSIMRPGHYRIDVDSSGAATTVRVADGQAQAIGRQRAYLINPGQAFRFGGTDLAPVQPADARWRDDFDRWSAARDRRGERSRAARYVSPALIGYEDLDENGTWRDVDGYGPVWMPTHVARGWAPYRDGHWAWVEPWGWTWVDDAPWGFATTHYGRWTNVRGDWAWVPGPPSAIPVYAPALVMFVAAGNLVQSRGRPGDGVAWFPLAPREVYRPSYRASPRYLTNINTSNTVVNQTQIINITNQNVTSNGYVNRRVPGAVTAVPARVFARAQPVRPVAVALPGAVVAAAPLMAAATVRAQRESLASHLASGHRPAPAALARPVMTPMATAGAPAIRPPVAQAAPTAPPLVPRGRDRRERDAGQPGWRGGMAPPMERELPPGPGTAAIPAHGVLPAPVGAGAGMPHTGRTLPPGPIPPPALPPTAAHNPAPSGMHGQPPDARNAPPHRAPTAAAAPPVPMPMAASQRHGPPHSMPPAPSPVPPAPMAAPHGRGPEHAMRPMPSPGATAPIVTARQHGPEHAMPPKPSPAVPTPMGAPHGHGPAHAMPPAPSAAQHPVQMAQHGMQVRPMTPAERPNGRPIAPAHPPARPMRAELPPAVQAPRPVPKHPPVPPHPAPPHPQPPRPVPHVEAPHPPAPPPNAHHEAPPQHPPNAPGKPDKKEARHGKD